MLFQASTVQDEIFNHMTAASPWAWCFLIPLESSRCCFVHWLNVSFSLWCGLAPDFKMEGESEGQAGPIGQLRAYFDTVPFWKLNALGFNPICQWAIFFLFGSEVAAEKNVGEHVASVFKDKAKMAAAGSSKIILLVSISFTLTLS